MDFMRKRINRFLNEETPVNLIVFDLETNGLEKTFSVLSCAAIKYQIDPIAQEMTKLDSFHRFYFPIEDYNPQAIEKNHLNKQTIADNRGECDYPEHFRDDKDFEAFCKDVSHFVAHNINFDAQFTPFVKSRKTFCTMKPNKGFFGGKWPSLAEAAEHYGVDYDVDSLHESLYDVEITTNVFQAMLKAIDTFQY